MAGHEASVRVKLAPNGKDLTLEFLSEGGLKHDVPVTNPGALGSTLTSVLQTIRNGRVELGTDGAPTSAQVLHWEKHSSGWPVATCRFCLSASAEKEAKRKARGREMIARTGGGVQINRISERIVRDATGKPRNGKIHFNIDL